MALATKRWVNGRLEDVAPGAAHLRRLQYPGSGIDWSICALGYVINPDGDDADEIKIVSGEIDGVAVAETKMVVLDAEFVYVRRTIADDTMLVTHAAAVPADSATYRYYKLYEFTVKDGDASIKKIWRPFSIETVPHPPDAENDYVLMSIAGAVKWVQTEEFACPI